MQNIRTGVTRRSAVAATAGIVAALPVLSSTAHADEQSWDAQADVVVVGAGGAGDMASLRLSQEYGMTVLEFESLDTPIGCSHLCGGGIDVCGTDLTPGSAEDMLADLTAAAQGDLQTDLAQAYVAAAPKVYEALRSWGVKFLDFPVQAPYMSQPWMVMSATGTGFGIMGPMEEAIAEDSNITLLTGTRARRLVFDEAGRAIGVEAETAEGTKRYGASKGVVLASGGFARNTALVKALGPQGLDTIEPSTGMGAMGDGLLMGLAAGADVSYLAAGTRPGATKGTTTGTLTFPYMGYGCILVGYDGKRFCNEADNYVLITSAALNKLKDFQMFAIYDSTVHEGLQGSGVFEGEAEPEFAGDTIEELISAIHEQYLDFTGTELEAQLERYNGYVEAGDDEEFHSIGFTGALGTPATISTPPYYAMALSPAIEDFRGGLKIDAQAHVVSAIDEAPIPGLYAAGEVTGGLHGYGYMSGTAFGKALIFGYIAADTIAAEA